MKRLIITGIVLLMVNACGTYQQPVQITSGNVIPPKGDKEEHELVVLDPGFDTWFQTQWSPAKDRSSSYYNAWNDRYVQAWNFKATTPGYAPNFSNTINYDYSENYGMEVSRKLYYYFQYVENELGISILN